MFPDAHRSPSIAHSRVEALHLLASACRPINGTQGLVERADGPVLAALVDAGRRGLNQASLGARLGLSPGAVSRLIDTMEARGLVVRTTHPLDRRSKVIELTPGGREQADAYQSLQQTRCDNIFGDFTPDELQTLKGLLKRVLGNVGTAPRNLGLVVGAR